MTRPVIDPIRAGNTTMPPTLRQCQDASKFLSDTKMGATFWAMNGHMMQKHGSANDLIQWLQRNPQATPEFGDLGLKSYFKLDEGGIHLHVMNTIANATAIFECPNSNSRAMFWKDFKPTVTGTSLGLSNTPIPNGMRDLLEVTGVLCIIEVYNNALVTGFPSDRPFGAKQITM